MIKPPFPLPPVQVFTCDDDRQVKKKALNQVLTADSDWVLVGVPGCFTPTCTQAHLPGFVNQHAAFRQRQFQVAFCSANDPFVLRAWLEAGGAANLFTGVADPELDLTEAFDLKLDLRSIGLGYRCKRFCAIIRNQQVTQLFIDERKLKATAAESVLKHL